MYFHKYTKYTEKCAYLLYGGEKQQYELLCADSMVWLKNQKNKSLKNVVTGIPDFAEVKSSKIPDIKSYVKWFNQIAELIMLSIQPNGYCIFIQTDRKLSGKQNPPNYKFEWISKSNLLMNCAKKNKFRLIWHKIASYRPIADTYIRPGYSHMLCFTKNGLHDVESKFPDVIDSPTKLYPNGTPYEALQITMDFIKKYYKSTNNDDLFPYDIVDPFIGQGTVGVVALSKGFSIFGIDIDPEQVKKTENNLANAI